VPLDFVDLQHDEAAALYQTKFVLVRPDGHVAWRGNLPPRDALGVMDIVRGAA
jgi:hypothetical protein